MLYLVVFFAIYNLEGEPYAKKLARTVRREVIRCQPTLVTVRVIDPTISTQFTTSGILCRNRGWSWYFPVPVQLVIAINVYHYLLGNPMCIYNQDNQQETF